MKESSDVVVLDFTFGDGLDVDFDASWYRYLKKNYKHRGLAILVTTVEGYKFSSVVVKDMLKNNKLKIVDTSGKILLKIPMESVAEISDWYNSRIYYRKNGYSSELKRLFYVYNNILVDIETEEGYHFRGVGRRVTDYNSLVLYDGEVGDTEIVEIPLEKIVKVGKWYSTGFYWERGK